MNESCLHSRTINPSLKTTVSEDPVPKTCDGWDRTGGEGPEGLKIKQKRKHVSPTFLAEIVQDIKVREAEEVQTIRRRRIHAKLPLPESHTVTSKLMLSPLTFFVETEDGIRVPAVPTTSLPLASPCAFRSSEHMELQKTVKKDGKQAVHMRRKKRSSAKSEESFPFSLEAW